MLGRILIYKNNMEYIKIIDNCVSQQFQDFLGYQLDAPILNWSFGKDVTNLNDTNRQMYPGFSNGPFENGQIQNSAYWFLYPLLLEVCNKQNIIVKELLRIRIRIGLNINRGVETVNTAHIDRQTPHMSALYYPHDYDGDTVFYTDKTATAELIRVTPKKGRMVLFDGFIYHASSNPNTSNYRIAVNYNFVV